jgi:hypothetical protein
MHVYTVPIRHVRAQRTFPISSSASRSCVKARTSRLDGLDFGLRPCEASKALRQLGAVEEVTLSGLDGAERTSWGATNAAREALLVQRAVLLSFLAVAGEGLGEVLGGRGRMRLGSMIDLCGQLTLRTIDC